jgi:hypothetical protein
VITGEVLGQRAANQKRVDLDSIAHHAGLEGRLLRPLSASLLAPTIPEREGLIDRARLHGFSGRGRKSQAALAAQLGISAWRAPSNGCALIESAFAARAGDLTLHEPNATRWDFELLTMGRHVRLSTTARLIVGRNAEDNARLKDHFLRGDSSDSLLIEPVSFQGPTGLLVGRFQESEQLWAQAILLRHARRSGPETVRVGRRGDAEGRLVRIDACADWPEAKPV